MKLVNKLTVVVTLVGFMFAGGIGLTWGNAYTNSATDVLTADHSFGVWMDVNDTAAFGWENGLKVGFAGPAGMQMRLGFDPTNDNANNTIEVEESLSLFDQEKRLIEKSLLKHKGKRKNAAAELGISERTLYRKLKEFGL